ncbi:MULTISPECIES: Wzz/FepE/Etk N-terminal domain-containing protein [Myxococcus]|uniref:Chain-length determining protein n=1 Tax=Myxococcus llanfairpwllgwyngyllgogerychwyrndrobwllllantysiliogogogochensis TaxID=2590453 RepID=A0A540WVD8_9BACT|nr:MULTISPECIES: Wzz/FepE/Etk N-terminal domain-containing protein [Myxococcus]NTX07958.1 chain-length determining protein [Myxococcus sp. CA040A]NTX14813.1 chain-length determining protein [Myxococcus sp. CA056]NTX55100.1 chain-length determining protein [Myxococcus sp. CA039A]TQF12989.1 chain-length determining protein [Myxococcus llanfairpwllgwyngyllgogerychwyrndrobwllllantysiliogogogochensis]
MERGMTADQLLASLWRRKALVGAITAAVFAVGAAIVMTRPSMYEASAVVRVEPQRPGEEMVQRTVSELIEQRLLTVRQELMARPVLQKAIEEMNLYPDIVSEKGMETAVAQMRKDLQVRVEGETAFEITYTNRDPQVAAQVANRLPTIFSEETLKLRQAQAARATDLFTEEMGSMGKAVSNWERKISQFKVDHLGELPEQMEMNMRGLERVSHELQTKSEELRVAEARRSDLARARNAVDSEAGRLESAESGLTRALVNARTTWTEDHPEIKRMQTELDGMTTRRKEAEGRLWAERAERGRVASLIEVIQKDIVDLQGKAEAYQARLNNTPKWAHELGVMNRDYEIARTKYQSVVSRKVEAEIAQELEAKSSKSLFNVISPAGVPVTAARPDRMTGLVIALLVALGLGILTGAVLEMRDDSLRDGSEVRQRLTLPVLAVVPDMQGKTERRVLMPSQGGRNNVSSPTSLN